MPTPTELILINDAISILAEICGARPDTIIEWMTGKTWDESEAAALQAAAKLRMTADAAIAPGDRKYSK